jgi:3-oxoacyl-[acyl-carrier protein] reductase
MGPRANFSAYACSKAALVRFTETLAEEVAALNIDANCVSPGVMVSALTAEVLQNAFVGGKEHEAVSRAKPGDEARAAELIAYLASPESDGITGRSISAVWDDWQNLRAIAVGDRLTLRRIS